MLIQLVVSIFDFENEYICENIFEMENSNNV